MNGTVFSVDSPRFWSTRNQNKRVRMKKWLALNCVWPTAIFSCPSTAKGNWNFRSVNAVSFLAASESACWNRKCEYNWRLNDKKWLATDPDDDDITWYLRWKHESDPAAEMGILWSFRAMQQPTSLATYFFASSEMLGHLTRKWSSVSSSPMKLFSNFSSLGRAQFSLIGFSLQLVTTEPSMRVKLIHTILVQ